MVTDEKTHPKTLYLGRSEQIEWEEKLDTKTQHPPTLFFGAGGFANAMLTGNFEQIAIDDYPHMVEMLEKANQ